MKTGERVEKGTLRRELNRRSNQEDASGANMSGKPGQWPEDNVRGLLGAQQDQHGESRWNGEMVMVWEQLWPKRERGPKLLRALQVTEGRQSPVHMVPWGNRPALTDSVAQGPSVRQTIRRSTNGCYECFEVMGKRLRARPQWHSHRIPGGGRDSVSQCRAPFAIRYNNFCSFHPSPDESSLTAANVQNTGKIPIQSPWLFHPGLQPLAFTARHIYIHTRWEPTTEFILWPFPLNEYFWQVPRSLMISI